MALREKEPNVQEKTKSKRRGEINDLMIADSTRTRDQEIAPTSTYTCEDPI
jgi:hypothetical protein